MKYLESPWAILVLALGFITMIEVLHMNAHTNCRADCPCPLIQDEY